MNSQLKYKIILTNKIIKKEKFTIKKNIIHYNFIKSKRIIQSILTLKFYSIINSINIAIFINTTIKIIIKQLNYIKIPIIIYINLYFLYNYLVKLKTTKKKKLIINIIAIR